MRIAFGIVSLFASGGLQRDCVDLARILTERGHSVTIFTARRQSGYADDLDVEILPNKSRTNHQGNLIFALALVDATRGRFDRIVGFDFLYGLDALYCPHPSMAYRVRKHPYLNLWPRYRVYRRLERECFSLGKKTKILLLAEHQRTEFSSVWHTEPERMQLLPPTVSPARRHPEYRTDGTRERLRSELNFSPDELLWLCVCAQPNTKGLDRTLSGLRQFPGSRLVVVGIDESDARAAPFIKLGAKLGVTDRIRWLGIREDVPELMAMADILVHPARADTTGTVILEAVINGLPVVTTAVCGYAHHVTAAAAGLVLRTPFKMAHFTESMKQAASGLMRANWSANGTAYGDNPWLYEARNKAIEVILSEAVPVPPRSDLPS